MTASEALLALSAPCSRISICFSDVWRDTRKEATNEHNPSQTHHFVQFDPEIETQLFEFFIRFIYIEQNREGICRVLSMHLGYAYGCQTSCAASSTYCILSPSSSTGVLCARQWSAWRLVLVGPRLGLFPDNGNTCTSMGGAISDLRDLAANDVARKT